MTERLSFAQYTPAATTSIEPSDAKLAVRIYIDTAITNEAGPFDIEPILHALKLRFPAASADYIYSCFARASAFTNFIEDGAEAKALTYAHDAGLSLALFQTVAKLPLKTVETADGTMQEFNEDAFVSMLDDVIKKIAANPKATN
ncbi:MAG: hypothetical protein COB37_01930 [Kordiimonadales bacterium]|nr:MAG: hypothetical protein COB37_01930 [Kordiimonadales bacterium]